MKIKQCDENCGDTCDNSRIYISNLPPDVSIDELQELFGGIGLVKDYTLDFFFLFLNHLLSLSSSGVF